MEAGAADRRVAGRELRPGHRRALHLALHRGQGVHRGRGGLPQRPRGAAPRRVHRGRGRNARLRPADADGGDRVHPREQDPHLGVQRESPRPHPPRGQGGEGPGEGGQRPAGGLLSPLARHAPARRDGRRPAPDGPGGRQLGPGVDGGAAGLDPLVPPAPPRRDRVARPARPRGPVPPGRRAVDGPAPAQDVRGGRHPGHRPGRLLRRREVRPRPQADAQRRLPRRPDDGQRHPGPLRHRPGRTGPAAPAERLHRPRLHLRLRRRPRVPADRLGRWSPRSPAYHRPPAPVAG